MRRFQFLAIFFLFSITQAFSQSASSKISGYVAHGGKSIETATIALLNLNDSLLVKMAFTDKNGIFEFANVKPGKYLVSVSALGYLPSFSAVFELAEVGQSITVPTITLAPASKELQQVTVTAKKPFVEQKLDRMIVNVDGQATNTGNTALEVLEKSPGITVDNDGNISLKGKAGVLILIDNKPSYLGGADLANLLRSMPSSQLEMLEIMTNPPAKYDASGSAGVINIKTKKNKAKGFNGSATVGAALGNKFRSNNSLNLNYRYNKWNLFANYSYNYNRNNRGMEITRKFYNQETDIISNAFEQHAMTYRRSYNQNIKLGADFFANKKTTFGLVIGGFTDYGNSPADNGSKIFNNLHELQSITNTVSTVKSSWLSGSTNFNMRHQFDSTGKELTADLDYVGYNNKNVQYFNTYFYDQYGTKSLPDELMHANLPSNIKIYSAKADYTHPITKNTKIEAGIKTSYVSTNNNAQYYLQESGQWQTDSGRTNHFLYKENINALYVNASSQFNKKWSGQLGVRVENTNTKGRQIILQQNFTRHYTQLFPTAYIGYAPNENNQLSINYGRRIERPDYEDMNPFYNFLDKFTYQVGNPNLQPEFTHNIELSHNFKGILTSTFNYSHTNDIISDILEQVDSTKTSFVKKSNIAQRKQYGLSVNANLRIAKWWSANIYTNGFHNDFTGIFNNKIERLQAWSYSLNVQNQFKIKKGWTAEIGGFYRSKSIDGVLGSKPMGIINFALGKQVLKEKGTIRLNFRDPFKLQVRKGYSKYQNVDVTIKNTTYNSFVNLSFMYRFGKPFKGQQSRKQGGADDEKSRVRSGGN